MYGYVGNKAATLPLNRLGFDVDAINSVQFSNHTGYPLTRGQVLDGEGLLSIVEGLEKNDMLVEYSHLLTGYMKNLTILEGIVDVVKKLKQANPDLVYVCDPVCGDDGKLYCPPELPQAFRKHILPLATILTPNQFEAELLTGMKIDSLVKAQEACKIIHQLGPTVVVLTSLVFSNSEDVIVIMASSMVGNDIQSYCIEVPRIHSYFTGTGDLFCALLLGWVDRYPMDLKTALEHAVSGLQIVLQDTASHAQNVMKEKNIRNDEREPSWWRCRELRLIQNQDALVSPEILYSAKECDLIRLN